MSHASQGCCISCQAPSGIWSLCSSCDAELTKVNNKPLTVRQKHLVKQHVQDALDVAHWLYMRPRIHYRLSVAEVESACLYALVRAARVYDPADNRKASFKTYAIRAMKQWAGRDAGQARLVHIPEHHLVNCQASKRQQQRHPEIQEALRVKQVDMPEFWEAESHDDGRYSDEFARLHRAINRLPRCHRSIIVRQFLRGEPRKGIAADMGVSESRVNLLKRQALDKLRQYLTKTPI